MEYRQFNIEFNTYGKNEYTVQYEGDDVVFETLDDAKNFIDEVLAMPFQEVKDDYTGKSTQGSNQIFNRQRKEKQEVEKCT